MGAPSVAARMGHPKAPRAMGHSVPAGAPVSSLTVRQNIQFRCAKICLSDALMDEIAHRKARNGGA